MARLNAPAKPAQPKGTSAATVGKPKTPMNTPSPVTKSSHPVSRTMKSLETDIKPFVTAEFYDTYQDIIYNLEHRGPRLPKVRQRYRPLLMQLLRDDPTMKKLHNKFASRHNARFEGRHDRFLLPIYDEAKPEETQGAIEPLSVPEASNAPKPGGSQSGPSQDPESPTLVDVHQTASSDSDESDQIADEEETVDDGDDEGGRVDGSALPSQDSVDPDDKAEDLATPEHASIEHGSDVSNIPEDDLEPTTEAFPASLPEDAQDEAHCPTSQIYGWSGVKKIGSKPWVHDPNKKEEDHDHWWDKIGPPVIINTGTKRENVQSAASYIAWLRQRRMAFPTTRPVYAECVAIAQKLERPMHIVFDEILYHWGLETDSKFGPWYKENRLQVLGEDP